MSLFLIAALVRRYSHGGRQQDRAARKSVLGCRENPPPQGTAAMLRVTSLLCIVLLAVLSLLPANDMVRTGLPGKFEHFVAYAGSATITVGGYGDRYGTIGVISFYWVYAGILEFLQQFSPGRHPSTWDFTASAFGALCGATVATLLAKRFAKRR
jgi:VanZ family protein